MSNTVGNLNAGSAASSFAAVGGMQKIYRVESISTPDLQAAFIQRRFHVKPERAALIAGLCFGGRSK